MIILCHFFQYYDNELCRWFNVGVQVFFVISGFLYGKKEIVNPLHFLFKGFKKIIVPYWIFLCFAVLLYYIFYRSYLSLTDVIKAFLCSGTIEGLGHLWFIGYILFCYLLTPYLYWVRKETEHLPIGKQLECYFFLLLVVQIIGISFNSYFHPDRVACYIIGFYIPSICKIAKKKQDQLLYIFVILSAFITNIIRIYVNYFSSASISETAKTVITHYSHMLLGVALFLILYQLFKHISYLGILRLSDKYSYSIYIVHLLFILSPFTLMSITNIVILNWIFVIIATFLLGYLLTELSSKILNSKS